MLSGCFGGGQSRIVLRDVRISRRFRRIQHCLVLWSWDMLRVSDSVMTHLNVDWEDYCRGITAETYSTDSRALSSYWMNLAATNTSKCNRSYDNWSFRSWECTTSSDHITWIWDWTKRANASHIDQIWLVVNQNGRTSSAYLGPLVRQKFVAGSTDGLGLNIRWRQKEAMADFVGPSVWFPVFSMRSPQIKASIHNSSPSKVVAHPESRLIKRTYWFQLIAGSNTEEAIQKFVLHMYNTS